MNRLTAVSRSLIVASIAAGALISLSSFASASPDRTLDPGDDRATAHSGNVVEKHCPDLFPGSTAVPLGDIEFTGGDNTAGVDITAVPDGIEIVGVIVKGGPHYNLYETAGLGDLPWQDLHAPLVPSGKPADVSHWFVCGVGRTETPPTTEVPTTTTSPEAEQPGGPAETTTSEDVSPAAEEEELAATGVPAGPLVAIGAALLLGGGALLLLMRRSAARR
ncbi:hypothetical protein [Actinophytocola sp.]|uniref:hypothetical protein n=1 Tax=Actinophytocola sp. TaxID=1872138 RepID=UPI003D6B4765